MEGFIVYDFCEVIQLFIFGHKSSFGLLAPYSQPQVFSPNWVGTTETSMLVFGIRAEDPAAGMLPEWPSESCVQLSTDTYQTQLDHGPLL